MVTFFFVKDVEGVNIDSDDFRKLPYEMQHEIIVEMREKNKRHSRYQTIDMPEVINLNNILKETKNKYLLYQSI